MKKINFEPIKAWWSKVDAFFTKHQKTVKTVGLVSLVVTLIAALTLTIVGIVQVNKPVSSYEAEGTITMIRLTTPEEEEYDEEEYTLCPSL